MTGDARYPRRRTADGSLGTRMTAVERDLYHLGLRLDAHLGTAEKTHEHLSELVEKLDSRTDALTTRVTVAFAVVGALITAAQILLPIIRDVLRIPPG